jgi:hypothetical protein
VRTAADDFAALRKLNAESEKLTAPLFERPPWFRGSVADIIFSIGVPHFVEVQAMESSWVPALTEQELLELVPDGAGTSLLAVERSRWLAYRAASELSLARERLVLARSILADVRAALMEDAVPRAALVQRIEEALHIL